MAFAGMCVVVYAAYRWLSLRLGHSGALPSTTYYFLCAVIAIAFFKIKYTDLPRAYALLHRLISAVLGIFVILNSPDYPMLNTDSPEVWTIVVNIGFTAAIGGTLVGFARPSLAAIPALYIAWIMTVGPYHTGFKTNPLDINPIIECSILLTIGAVANGIVSGGKFGHTLNTLMPVHQRTLSVFFVALGIHFGNYFYSAIEKITLDGGPLTWVLENDPARIMRVAVDNGHVPYQQYDQLTLLVHDMISEWHVVLAFLVLGAQLFSIVAIASRRLLILFTLMFDAMHIMIWLTVGANFWPWVGLNISILSAVRLLPKDAFSPSLRFVAVISVACSTIVFGTAHLGWYDTGANNKQYHVAIDDEGRETLVPPNFFGFYSYIIGHMSYGMPFDGHFPTRTEGGSDYYAFFQKAIDCNFSPADMVTPVRKEANVIRRFVKAYHAKALAQVDEDGHPPTGFRIHHFWMPPGLTKPFYSLDLRTVVAYKHVVESVCVTRGDKGFERTVKVRSEMNIDVR
jgi:hypothetical protein